MLTTKHALQTSEFMAQTEVGAEHYTEAERFAIGLVKSAQRMPQSVRDEIDRAQRPR